MGPWRCRLKDLFEFAQGLRAGESWVAYPDVAAGRNVKHPERDFQDPTSLDVSQAAVRHRPAPSYETGMHPHFPTVPWVPGVADSTGLPNMGVVLLSCTTRNAITRAKATSYCFLRKTDRGKPGGRRFYAGNASAVC